MHPTDPPSESSTIFATGPQTCAVCGAPLPPGAASESPLFPFCSRRCKVVDLFRWTEGRYAVVEPLTIERLLEEQAGVDPDADAAE